MRAPLSVVIPTLDAAAELGPCLAALFEGLEAGLVRELIVSDGGSGDGTLALAEEAGAVVVAGTPGRGGQLARGALAAGGGWLLFLHADTRLAPGWADQVQRHMAARPEQAAAFRLRFDVAGWRARLVAGWANLRSRLFGLPYGDQGLLISRALYEAVGGYPDIALMEDVALAQSLRGRIRLLAGKAVTSGAKFQREGWFWRGGRNLWRLLRFLAGADPEGLARRY
jgi:rSAM/selenodomain-associated transferase 2